MAALIGPEMVDAKFLNDLKPMSGADTFNLAEVDGYDCENDCGNDDCQSGCNDEQLLAEGKILSPFKDSLKRVVCDHC